MRLIDADAFKDYIRGALENTRHLYKDNGAWAEEITESFCKDIDEQPTASSDWMPVTEQMPKAYAEVLVWFEYFRYGNYNCLYQTYGIGSHDDNFNVWLINHETGWDKLRVIAWMPLPEPYKEEQDE